MICLLPESRWQELSDIFEKEFDADLPDEGRANIVADIDEKGNIDAFVVVETLLRIGQIHIEKGKSNPLRLIRYLQENITKGSVIVIASEERFEGICEKLGMREMTGKVYRIDL